MSSVLRTVKEVGGADKYYKVTAIPGVGFPVLRNGVWIKLYNKFVNESILVNYLIVRDLGSETRITSIDPLFIEDFIKPRIQGDSINIQYIDIRIVTPGWARKVQLILTPDIPNELNNATNDGNEMGARSNEISGNITYPGDSFTTEQFNGPSPTFVGGNDYDMPCFDKGFMKTKYNIFHVITRPLLVEYSFFDTSILDPVTGAPILQKKQWMIKNSMILTN